MLVARKVFGILAIAVSVPLMFRFMGGDPRAILKSSVLLPLLGLSLLTSFYHLGIKGTVQSWLYCLFGVSERWRDSESVRQLRAHGAIWVMYSANILAFLGMIHMMIHLDDPSQIGSGVAMAFTAYVYGAALVLILGGDDSGVPVAAVVKPKISTAFAFVPALVCVTVFMTVMFAIGQADYQKLLHK